MAVPYTFGSATTSIPLSQLDSNFATTITLGNTAVQLGNTITNLTGVSNVASATSLSLGSNGNTTAITVDTSQNVGVGTSSPSSKLHVSGTGTLEVARFATITDNTPSIGIYSNGVFRAKLRASSAETALLTQGATPLLFGTSDTESMRINAGAPILCLAGGSTTATGTGIAFPATQSASSDANTLDDYEEGSWTPNDASGAGLTFTVNASSYIKIGQIVTVSCYIIFPTNSSAATVLIGGLPFVANSANTYYYGLGRCQAITGFSLSQLGQNATTFSIYSAVTTQLTNLQATGAYFLFSATYRTSS